MKNFLVFLIPLFFISCDDKKYKEMPVDTLLNYPGAVVLSKIEMYTEVYRIITIRIKTKEGYVVKELKIPRSEWIMVNLGDTIGNINIKEFCNYYELPTKYTNDISSINNYKGGIVIEKELDDITFTDRYYSLTIKRKNFTGNHWRVYKIRVVESEYESVEVGDTIK